MYFIYSLLLGLALILLLPRFIFDALRHGKYVAGFRERLGSLSPIQNHGQPIIWIHCVSVGETQAARPLVQGLKERYPNHSLVISTITLTGQNLARQIFKDDVAKVFYFPFDWRWVARRTLKKINPVLVLLMETELWPGFLRECKAQEIPTAIVNGRLSQQSFRNYSWIKGFMTRVLSSLSLAIVQTDADAERLRKLGMPADKTYVSGNIKFDVRSVPFNDSLSAKFRERFKLTDEAPLILAASTHAPEEAILLDAFRQVAAGPRPKPRLMIAPRHPERFSEVAELIKASRLRFVRRTAAEDPSDGLAEVVLLDTIGELQAVYSLSPIVFVGGSVANTGGHNILEPAAAAAAVITGPHTYNFQSVVKTFVDAGAIIQLTPMSDSASIIELGNAIAELLDNPGRRQEIGEHAKTLVAQNRGATERTLNLLGAILSNPVESVESPVPVTIQRAPST